VGFKMDKINDGVCLERDVSSSEFRQVMRRLVGGVSLVTVGQGHEITGMTVTSIASLSAEPPSLVVIVNRSASSWPLLKRNRFFGVSILHPGQVELAERFAGRRGVAGADRFADAEWITRVSGTPLLATALAAIECEIEDIVERHSHAIVIGRPIDLILSQPTAALAYWHGQYRAVDRAEDEIELTRAP
jgi:flavin reductase (DIM6/NTAB) family NADH-FMN oxidoreductase RutF